MTDDERDAIGDLMLADMRERERARRGSDLTDEKRFGMLTQGEMPPPRQIDLEAPDISGPDSEPECPVCEGDGEAPAGTYSPARASIPSCSECGGTGKAHPVQIHRARDFDSMAAEYGFHGEEPLAAVRLPSEAELRRACFALTEDGGALLAPHHRNEAARRLLRALEDSDETG